MSTEQARHKTGVVLFQLGGPDSLDAVEPFLYNLFRDPDIIDFPFARLAREPLARLVAATRAHKVRHAYAAMGGGSPINQLTQRQAQALESVLGKNLAVRVVVAMRYWHPLTEEAIETLQQEACTDIVLLPLYPQYSKTTTGSSLNEWRRQYARRADNHVRVHTIRDFHDFPPYIEALVERIQETLAMVEPAGKTVLVFSAHGIPASVVAAGDPYQQQVEATTQQVMRRGGWNHPCRICYQSKVGPGRWLAPSLESTVRALASEKAEGIVVAPISFVSDHIETFHEIDGDARALAKELGIRQFRLMPGLNDSPKFIQALADLVRLTLRGSPAGSANPLDSVAR